MKRQTTRDWWVEEFGDWMVASDLKARQSFPALLEALAGRASKQEAH